MTKYNKDDLKSAGGLAIILFIPILMHFFVMWTDGNLEWALGEIKGHAVDIPYWMSFLIAIILNAVIIAFNIICTLLQLV